MEEHRGGKQLCKNLVDVRRLYFSYNYIVPIMDTLLRGKGTPIGSHVSTLAIMNTCSMSTTFS
jgi:hypothetical protein